MSVYCNCSCPKENIGVENSHSYCYFLSTDLNVVFFQTDSPTKKMLLREATAAAGVGINCCLQISKRIKAGTKDATAGKVCNQDVPKVLIEYS